MIGPFYETEINAEFQNGGSNLNTFSYSTIKSTIQPITECKYVLFGWFHFGSNCCPVRSVPGTQDNTGRPNRIPGMTTTSLLPHKPPPLKPRNNSAVFLRTNYYGSVGRPSNGKRKSAVELLEETKAFYVKSESVLDAKQELKNADHLHVRSPTVDVAMLRSPAPPLINGGGPFPFAMCLTCPPYPHQHFEHFDHYQIHQNAHNHHLSQGSLHQQQHHLSAPSGSAGGNSSGPPSVESGGTASTGSTGGGGVTAITTLGRSTKHHQHSHHQHSHHHHHHHNHHHTKSHRSSSTGSSGSRHLQENSLFPSGLLIEPNISSLKTSTMGRTKRSVQPPGSLPMPKHLQSQLKKDSGNMLAALLPGMSFTLPAQSSLQKQAHHHHQHHHHSHHYQFLLQQQQLALASLTNNTSGALSLPSGTSSTSTIVGSNHATSTTTSSLATAGNGLRGGGGGTTVASTAIDKHSSLVSSNNSILAPIITNTSAQLQTTGQLSSSLLSNVKSTNHGAGHHRGRNVDDDSPPPLPPKSPRITSKPARPHDFPQQLQLQVVDPSIESAAVGGKSSNVIPPPPPRRQSQKDPHAKYLRLMQDQSSAKLPPHSILDPTQSMTLPSPILPPTPPPDVVMESPMSDSGPIISPPPAFSTPVTPMVDRQNSTTSDKSGGGGATKPGGASGATSSTTASTSVGTTTNNVGRLRSLSQSTSHYHNITGFSLATSGITAASSGGVTGGTSGITTSKSNSQSQSQHQQQQQQTQQHHYHTPLSGTVSMSAISSVSGKNNGTRNNKSIPDLSSADISLRYSPMSRSRSNSSPMSPASSPDDDEDDDDDDDDADEDPTSSSVADNGHDGDDDCSEKGQMSSISSKLLAAGVARRNSVKLHSHQQHHSHHNPPQQQNNNKKVTLIPKSVTENFLYKVGATGAGTANTTSSSSANVGNVDNDMKKPSTSSITEASQQPNRSIPEAPSPARRPILRSKSDLSHRYAKAEKSATLTSGFTLVHVDLGLPPAVPMHNSVSTNDFSTNVGVATTSTTATPIVASTSAHKSHYQHHIYQTPNSIVNTTSTAPSAISHYHEPHNPHPSEMKRATKSASDLERFFDMLGLENNPTPAPVSLSEIKESTTVSSSARAKAGSESPVFFSSVSSVDSAPRRSGSVDSEDSPTEDKLGSRTVGGYGKFGHSGGPSILVQHGEPSIVERNARVIKWLFNCRKAMERR